MKHIKLVLGIIIMLGVVYFSWMLIPPYFANYQLQDAIDNEALLNTYTNKSESEIRDSVIRKAQEYNIQLQPEQVNVQKSYNRVSIEANYTVHIDVPYHPFDLEFHTVSKNKGI